MQTIYNYKRLVFWEKYSERKILKTYMWHSDRPFDSRTLFFLCLYKCSILHNWALLVEWSVPCHSHWFHTCQECPWWSYCQEQSIPPQGLDWNHLKSFYFLKILTICLDYNIFHRFILNICLLYIYNWYSLSRKHASENTLPSIHSFPILLEPQDGLQFRNRWSSCYSNKCYDININIFNIQQLN